MQLIPSFPALLIEEDDEKIIVISDLHIGWEAAFSQEGIHIPSQTGKLLRRLEALVDVASPTSTIILGDLKHTVERMMLEEWRDVPHFLEQALKLTPKIKIIPGNHDGNIDALLPPKVELLPAAGIKVGDIGLVHGHAWPSPNLLGCQGLVIGHVHPQIILTDELGFKLTRQVWVKAECNPIKLAESILKYLKLKPEGDVRSYFMERFNITISLSKILIMPAFNDFIGGRSINKPIKTKGGEYLGPILRSGSIDLSNAEVFLLDGSFVGKIGQLQHFTNRPLK